MGWIDKLRLGITSNDGKGVGIRTTFLDIQNNLKYLKTNLSLLKKTLAKFNNTLEGMSEKTTEKVVDLSSLDEGYLYPVLISLSTNVMYEIHVKRGLNYAYKKPLFSTHKKGFTCYVKWFVNASGWGSIPVDRLIFNAIYYFTNKNPIGEIGQLTNSSKEFIYLRGGSQYEFLVKGSNDMIIDLITESTTYSRQTITPKTESAPPKTLFN